MGFPKIGLEAVLDMVGFKRNMADYTSGVGEMEQTTDKAAGRMSKLGSAMGKLAKTGLVAAAGGATAVVGGLTAYIASATKAAAETEGVRRTFDSLNESIGVTSETMLTGLQQATRGMVADSDLMQASNKFVAMGLADTAEEAAQLAEMATQLGSAMGEDATYSMENFALMLANQSIPRLDSFGISSGKVRERIDELMKADESLTREQAFMTAVMEQGAVTMAKVGEQADTTAANSSKIAATMKNLKETVGRQFLPIWGKLLGKFSDFINDHAPQIQAAFEAIAAWVSDKLIPVLMSMFDWIAENLPIALEWLGNAWERVLQPALETVWQFIKTKVVPILKTVWEWLRENLPVAIRWLSTLWEQTLKPALETVWAFIANNVVPALVTIWGWLRQHVPEAIAWLADKWENVLQPALRTVWEFIKTKVVPILQTVWAWLQENIPEAIAWASEKWKTVLQPALEAIWQFIQTYIIPIFIRVWEWLNDKIPVAIDVLKWAWEYVLKPALEVVWAYIQGTLIPVFIRIWEWLKEKIPQAIDWLRSAWENVLKPVFEKMAEWAGIASGAISGIKQALIDLYNWIMGPGQGVFQWWKDYFGGGWSPAPGTPFQPGTPGGPNWNPPGGIDYTPPAMPGAGITTTTNVGGDTVTYNVNDPLSYALAQSIVAEKRRARRNEFMGV